MSNHRKTIVKSVSETVRTVTTTFNGRFNWLIENDLKNDTFYSYIVYAPALMHITCYQQKAVELPAICVCIECVTFFQCVFFFCFHFCFGFGFRWILCVCFTWQTALHRRNSWWLYACLCVCVCGCMLVYNVNINVCQIGTLIIFIRLHSTGSWKCSSECVQFRRSTMSPSRSLFHSLSLLFMYLCVECV